MIISLLSFLILIWYWAMVIMAISGTLITRRFRSAIKKPTSPSAHQHSTPSSTSVSILRPLCGLDPNLYFNLESVFLQQYPSSHFEILLSVASFDDPAIPLAQSLIKKYPSIDAKLLIGQENVGVNPKINNLMPAYRTAKFDLVWILDSNILVLPATLARAIAAFKSRSRPIGLVHHIPVARLPPSSPRSIGSILEYCFLNGNHARQYVAINSIAIESCLVGKSNLFFRSDLKRATLLRSPSFGHRIVSSSPSSSSFTTHHQLSGLECFGQYLSEDNMIGKTLWDVLDLRHAFAPDPVYNIVGEMSLASYCRRRVRWIRARKYMCFLATLVEPFTESILLGILTTISLTHLTTSFNMISSPFPSLQFFLLHILFYFILDYTVLKSLEPQPELGLLAFSAGWLAREILAFPIWAFAFWGGDQVEWRQKEKLMVKRDGRAVRVD